MHQDKTLYCYLNYFYELCFLIIENDNAGNNDDLKVPQITKANVSPSEENENLDEKEDNESETSTDSSDSSSDSEDGKILL